MEQILDNVSNFSNETWMIVGGIVVAVLVALILFYRAVKIKSYRKKVLELEDEINAIKTLPIRYRLGRVKAIGQSAPEIRDQYDQLETEFEELETYAQNEIYTTLADLDEKTYYRKISGVKKEIKNLWKMVENYNSRSQKLLEKIEDITEIENDQRLIIIATKERYRSLCDKYGSLRYKIEEFIPMVSEKIKEIDSDFVALEELMNYQKYLEAKDFNEELGVKINFLVDNIDNIAQLAGLCKNYLPGQIELVKKRRDELVARGFAINLLDANDRFDKIQNELDEQCKLLKELQLEGLEEKIELTSKDVNQLLADFTEEQVAFDGYASRKDTCFETVEELIKEARKATRAYALLKENYVLDGYGITLDKDLKEITMIVARKNQLEKVIQEKEFSFSKMLRDFDDLISHCNHIASNIEKYYILDENLRIQEKRALDELDNISIVLLEIKSEISNNHLPMINDSYKDYIEDSYAKADAIMKVTKIRPINLEELSLQVDAARDVIYKLYDNVHHLIVTAQMVEEAIMFGNRYRSSYLEVNTELTKAELLFKNGEYTNALKIAVEIIEKIAPGSYEKLILKKEGK